ncbi:putative glucan endo- -alpha-glucosidase agn1 protein [Neofusicoccum parvum]|uniref:Glucan endo- -alpha-glucosidase agn1 protein n=1 Tax=Neofusicoccum parvum TaxID=310453 RepID=A0ACB5SNZ3_9PEZI|nr:putative glucan endo- -alpha-glucosidase agn1 protein [Neofusicoccum parvum]
MDRLEGFWKKSKREVRDLLEDVGLRDHRPDDSQAQPPPPPFDSHPHRQQFHDRRPQFDHCHDDCHRRRKGIFCHYMVGSMGSIEQAHTDVREAKSVGFDAFVLNVQNVKDDWSLTALSWVFSAAEAADFKLLFSFDMDVLADPVDFLPLFVQYQAHPAYYHYQGHPFVSTFQGGRKSFDLPHPNEGWTLKFRAELQDRYGIIPFFVPDFDDHGGAAYDNDFFNRYPVVDGVFSWETAWPFDSDGRNDVSSAADEIGLQCAHHAGKVYMMPMSSLQFKRIDGSGNWYRRGELNLAQRMAQVLALSPDFVQIISWNDAGESHYIGNVWQEGIASCPDIGRYTDGYDHKAWLHVIAPFIAAFKAGATHPSQILPFGSFTGAFWYRDRLADTHCPGDCMGRPSGCENAEDAVNFAVLLPHGTQGVGINVWSGGELLASIPGQPGLNAHSVKGVKTGPQRVELIKDGAIMGAGDSPVNVTGEADEDKTYNYNYHVVHIS